MTFIREAGLELSHFIIKYNKNEDQLKSVSTILQNIPIILGVFECFT